MPEYDVLVIGGGPAGIGAALTSAKKGLKTCIIERHPMLGGNWTNGFVLSILGVYTYSGNTKIVGGIVDELVDRLKKHGGTQGQRGNFIPFRPDEMKLTLEEFVNDLGITIYYSSMLTGVEVTDSAVKDVEITGKNGITRISAKMYIDSTGDADLAQLSTKNSMSGKEENGEHQEATLPFIPSVRNACIALASSELWTSAAKKNASIPRYEKAELCINGESECFAGMPIMQKSSVLFPESFNFIPSFGSDNCSILPQFFLQILYIYIYSPRAVFYCGAACRGRRLSHRYGRTCYTGTRLCRKFCA